MRVMDSSRDQYNIVYSYVKIEIRLNEKCISKVGCLKNINWTNGENINVEP